MSADPLTFVDSNILLYSVDSRDPLRRAQATNSLHALWATRTGRLSWQVLHEFYWNAVRKMGVNRDAARQHVELYDSWKPIASDAEIIRRAWYWETTANISFWDSMIVSAAERANCTVLLSEDLQTDRHFGSVEVVNPFS